MMTEDVRFNRRLALLIAVSFIFCATVIVLRLGIDRTSYEATDSAGRRMGFNDPLGAEHYLIILQNFSFADLFKLERVYEWILLLMHAIGAALLLGSGYASGRLTRWFFAIQPLLFPIGVPAILILPMVMLGLLTGTVDREGFVDIPFIICTAHSGWVLTSLFITFAIRGPGLGLARVKDAFSRVRRTGLEALAGAIR